MKTQHTTLRILALAAMTIGHFMIAQNENKKLNPEVLNELITTKISMDKKGVFKDRYTIQLYFGDRENANENKEKYDDLNMDWDCEMYWESPNLAVRVGKFRNKLEADRALIAIREYFPNAIVMKP
jgi:hypothetical protein